MYVLQSETKSNICWRKNAIQCSVFSNNLSPKLISCRLNVNKFLCWETTLLEKENNVILWFLDVLPGSKLDEMKAYCYLF